MQLEPDRRTFIRSVSAFFLSGLRGRSTYSKVKAGRVISTKPPFGALRPGGTKVALVVSKGRRK